MKLGYHEGDKWELGPTRPILLRWTHAFGYFSFDPTGAASVSFQITQFGANTAGALLTYTCSNLLRRQQGRNLKLDRGGVSVRYSLVVKLLTVALATSAAAFGQAVNGALVGTITDATGAVVPDARDALH